ncbi:MAG: ABC transporter substrate-binding protein [Pusillimonas sp.]
MLLTKLKNTAIAAAAVATLCASSFALAQNAVRIGGTGNYGPVLPVAAAEKLELFKQLGVEVTFTTFSSGAAGMEGLAAKEVDLINYFPPGLALAKRSGVKARVVGAGTLTPRGWHVMVKNDSPLKEVKDLAGKKLGISGAGSTTDFFGLWAASQSGGGVTRIPVGGQGLIPNMRSGNVDAIVAYPPLSYTVMLSGDGRSLVDFGSEMPINLPDVWVASDEIIEKNPEGLRKALIGIYSAIVYMQAHPEWTIEFISSETGMTKEIATEEYKNTIKGLSADGALKQEWVAESLKLATLAGIKDVPPVDDMFTTEFVPVESVQPEKAKQ